MKSYCVKVGLQSEREILKSFDLLKNLGEGDIDTALEILDDFILVLKKSEVKINIVYTTFNPTLLNVIKIYGRGSPSKQISLIKFLNLLTSYYPYVAVWRCAQTTPLEGSEIFLDSFDGEITGAWSDIENENISVLPCGDQCNAYISASDIVCKWVDKALFKNKLKLHETDLKSLFAGLALVEGEDYEIFFCGQPHLPKIVPSSNKKIPLHNYYKRPMIFVLSEGIMGNESKFMEGSPYWDKILKYASDNNTGIKHICYSEDYKNIKIGDHLLYFGENAKKQAEYLLSLGYNIISKDIKTIV
ncbi:MAG: hypothetical protein M1165_00090 [Candidatus Pacearchaeota archaeon]|nr:hypothetical protein [Candidatus Pacearchaeota archaeon]